MDMRVQWPSMEERPKSLITRAGERVCREARRKPVKRSPHGREPWGDGGLLGWAMLEETSWSDR